VTISEPGGPIHERLLVVRERIAQAATRAGRDPAGITLVAVSKTQPAELVRAAAAAGQLVFGENRIEEAQGKMLALDEVSGLEWHMIGHVQSRKAREAAGAGFVLIHSVDTLKLAERLGQFARAAGRRQRVLLEINVSGEVSKAGFRAETREQWAALLPSLKQAAGTAGLHVQGLMTMAPQTMEPALARPFFERLRELSEYLAEQAVLGPAPVLSMGMSDDFEAAIEAGAAMVRIGRAIFGERDEQLAKRGQPKE
jgi:pyridoxal phosphate enzyme (YggS family)